MLVQIDQAGDDEPALGVDNLSATRDAGPASARDPLDPSVRDDDVRGLTRATLWFDQSHVADDDIRGGRRAETDRPSQSDG